MMSYGSARSLWRGGVEMPDLTARYIQTHSPVPELHNAEMRVIW